MAYDLPWILSREESFRYQLLDRMRTDCKYYLGNGCRDVNRLWAKDEKTQIDYMEAIWRSFPKEGRPKWLTLKQIKEYKRLMVRK